MISELYVIKIRSRPYYMLYYLTDVIFFLLKFLSILKTKEIFFKLLFFSKMIHRKNKENSKFLIKGM